MIMDRLLLFDPSIGSDNIGDQVIMNYCEEQLMRTECSKSFVYKVPTHLKVGKCTHQFNKNSKYSVVCGSNILKTTILINQLWKISFCNAIKLHDLCLFGVGWHNYTSFKMDPYTKWVYKRILSKTLLHSVRDRYTEHKLREMGFPNVVFTACPSMWKLSPEFCHQIPKTKAEKVITTFTYYKKDVNRDRAMMNILLDSYSTVFFFSQQVEDVSYLSELGYFDRVTMIKPSLEAFDEVLRNEDVDFVGTRLHAGIRALNLKRRSLIVAVDNRAAEIGKDTNLPIIFSKDLNILREMLEAEIYTKIVLPVDNINAWKSQFS